MTASNLLRQRDRDDQLGVVRFYNALADRSALLQWVLAGLQQTPRSLFSQGLHDPVAARLQQQLGQQPEYYLARAETEVLQSMAAELAALATREPMEMHMKREQRAQGWEEKKK